MRRMGGRERPQGSVNLKIPFHNLHVIMEVEIIVSTNDVLTLLCMPDMIKNNLNISLRDRCLKFEKNRTDNYLELQSYLHVESGRLMVLLIH